MVLLCLGVVNYEYGGDSGYDPDGGNDDDDDDDEWYCNG